MIELIYIGDAQTVGIGEPVLYNAHAVKSCNCNEKWRKGSGIVHFKSPGRYLVSFTGNIAVPASQTVGEISLGVAVDGEIIPATISRVTPATIGEYFNVTLQAYVDVSCCEIVSIENTSNIPILVDSANLIVTRG